MSTSPASPPPSDAAVRPRNGLGLFCILLGGVLAVPSGACTGIMILGSIVDTLYGVSIDDAVSIVLMGLLFAALPFIGGIVLIIVGLKMRKEVA